MRVQVLQKGSKGSYVEQVQRRLTDWGLSLDVDGDFGNATDAAVRVFQSKRQDFHPFAGKPLTVDGVVNEATWAELFKVPVEQIEVSTDLITIEQARSIFGRTPTPAQMADLNDCLNRFEINTVPRMRHFLAQIAHESGGLKWMLELASGRDYEGRRDLGNTQPGDGVKFKGAGFIQLTGRANYTSFAKAIGDPLVVEKGAVYVAERYPASSAAHWWDVNRMNALIDRGASVEQVTRRVNGGTNGLTSRIKYYQRACDVIK